MSQLFELFYVCLDVFSVLLPSLFDSTLQGEPEFCPMIIGYDWPP